jgi:hypothetical protein
MTTGFQVNGVDLDTIFEPRTTTAIANTGHNVAGVDLAQRFEKLASGSAASATGFKVNVADLSTLFAKKGSVSAGDTGSIVQAAAGPYTHTFISNVTVALNYLWGAGGSDDYHDGGVTQIKLGSTVLANAKGGIAGQLSPGVGDGTATNSIGGTNTTGGGSPGGVGDWYGGNGGAVTGGSFTATAGQVLTIYVGQGGDGTTAGTDGRVSISWHP